MTVGELIAKLQEMPQDLPVMSEYENVFWSIEWVGRASLYDDDNDVVVLAEHNIFNEGA